MKLLILCLFLLSNSFWNSQNSANYKNTKTYPSNEKYKLVWADEFDYSGRPNPKKWGYEIGFVRNYEAQYYTNRKKNARVKNGYLIISSRKENFKNKAFKSIKRKNWRLNKKYAKYTSASLTTKGIAAWKYGKIEVRAKLPKGLGAWSAIWMLSENKQFGQVGNGEIDIMENVGFEPNSIYGTVHYKSYKNKKRIEKSKKITVEKIYDVFHVYSIEWTPEKIDFMVNGNIYHQILKNNNKWAFDQTFYLKINNAIGGSWGGKKGIDDKSFPQKMFVDYVRVYQLVEKQI